MEGFWLLQALYVHGRVNRNIELQLYRNEKIIIGWVNISIKLLPVSIYGVMNANWTKQIHQNLPLSSWNTSVHKCQLSFISLMISIFLCMCIGLVFSMIYKCVIFLSSCLGNQLIVAVIVLSVGLVIAIAIIVLMVIKPGLFPCRQANNNNRNQHRKDTDTQQPNQGSTEMHENHYMSCDSVSIDAENPHTYTSIRMDGR